MRLSEAVATQPRIQIKVGGSKGAPGDPGPQGPAGDIAKVATRSAMASTAGAAMGMSRLLVEDGREGVFIFQPGDWSDQVTADTAQGVFVAPASDATGASGVWKRKVDGAVNVLWFGAVADDSGEGSYGTDSYAAFRAAYVMACALGVDQTSGGNAARGGRTVFVPAGKYYVSQAIECDQGAVAWQGESGAYGGAKSSQIRTPDGEDAFIVQRANTTGQTGTGASHDASDYCAFRELSLVGPDGLTNTGMGIRMRARAHVEDCSMQGYKAGIYVKANSPDGNANCWSASRCRISQCRYGIWTEGGDANQGKAELIDGSFCYERPIFDASGLGNLYTACHSLSCGILNPKGGVNYSGQCYTPKPGQEEAARTHAPSGTTADNAYWLWVATYTQADWSTWTDGMAACDSTGGPRISGASNQTKLDFCYSEGEGPTLFEGHSHANHGTYSSRNPLYNAGAPGPRIYTQEGVWRLQSPGGLIIEGGDGSAPMQIGNTNGSLNIGPDSIFRLFGATGVLRIGSALEIGSNVAVPATAGSGDGTQFLANDGTFKTPTVSTATELLSQNAAAYTPTGATVTDEGDRIRITATASPGAYAIQNVNVTAGKTYRFRATQHGGTAGNNNSIDFNGTTYSFASTPNVDVTFVAGSTTTLQLYVLLRDAPGGSWAAVGQYAEWEVSLVLVSDVEAADVTASGTVTAADVIIDGVPVTALPLTFNFTAAGDAYFYADEAMTLTQQATVGTGTIAYAKGTTAAPTTFSSTTSPISLQAGAWLKVSASSVTGGVAVHLKRTA